MAARKNAGNNTISHTLQIQADADEIAKLYGLSIEPVRYNRGRPTEKKFRPPKGFDDITNKDFYAEIRKLNKIIGVMELEIKSLKHERDIWKDKAVKKAVRRSIREGLCTQCGCLCGKKEYIIDNIHHKGQVFCSNECKLEFIRCLNYGRNAETDE